ncbi:LysR family transcriptional regulator [Solirhodobacter olei]|uniref:LysR family transcriptional regulator n=1 Tax=Solirhodobacter olei TaxID=2493082 RepID=UPI0019D4CC06|nr:LysR family transcriptional regulator [Solirhodobacter olei]
MLDQMTHLFRLKAIAEAGSLRKAAAVLNVTQPALSRTIAQLEARFGQPLLERSSQGVTLTQYGARVLASVQRLARHWEIAEEELKTSDASLRGRLLLRAGPLWRAVVLPKLIGRLQERFPELVIDLQNLQGDGNMVDLLEGRCDILFGGTQIIGPADRRLQAMQFTSVNDVVVAREDHPVFARARYGRKIEPEWLLDYPWLVYSGDPNYADATMHAPLERVGFSPDVKIRCESLISAIGLLQNSECLCILPDAALTETRNPRIVPVPVSMSRRQVHSGAIFRQEMAGWPPLEELMSLCKERFSQ